MLSIYIYTYIYIYIYGAGALRLGREFDTLCFLIFVAYIETHSQWENYTQPMEKPLKNKHNINKPMKNQRNTKQIQSKP